MADKYLFPFLVEKDDKIYFNGGKLEIFIPKSYFKNDIAEMYGTFIESLAIFVFKFYEHEDDVKCKTFQISLPEKISFKFSESEEFEGEVKRGMEIDKYYKFILYSGDEFLNSVNIPKSYKHMEAFVNLHHTTKIPQTTEYHDILNLYLDSMSINGTSLRMPLGVLEMMISELARDSNNAEIPFRKAIGPKGSKVQPLDYKQISIKNLATINSTFTAITSEDMNRSIISSVNKYRNDGLEVETPIEKTIKY